MRARSAYIKDMRKIAPLLIAAFLAQPAIADDKTEGLGLMERGAELFFRGLMDDMAPALDELRDLAEEMGPQMQLFLEEMGPRFGELLSQIDDLTHYEAPEILPNGDIIIRRKPDAPRFTPDEIEL